ncbi:MAG TPA: hypothetical protein PKB02_18470, partial [Anaerohalosphaeraceae bacterium]|nr:hypothetical protein [Anaerohalosphaeraceae bacterium]
EKAKTISDALSNHSEFKSHGRHISRDDARKLGLIVDNLEANEKVQDLALSVFHATTHTFNGTPAAKIIENHLGRAFIKSINIAPLPKPPTLNHLFTLPPIKK